MKSRRRSRARSSLNPSPLLLPELRGPKLLGAPAAAPEETHTQDSRPSETRIKTVVSRVGGTPPPADVFRLLVEQSLAGIALIRDGRFRYVNPRLAEMFGYSEAELLALESVLTLVAEEDRARVANSMEQRLSGQAESEHYTFRCQRKDGQLFAAEVLGLRTELDGQPAILSTLLDITERVRAEALLRDETAHVELLKTIASDVNEAPTFELAALTCLERVCKLTGWPIGHVYLRDDSDTLVPTPLWHLDDPDRFRAFREITEATQFRVGEGLPGRVAASGRPVWISDLTRDANFVRGKAGALGVKAGFGSPVQVNDGIVGVLEFFSTDVTEPNVRLLAVMEHVGVQLGHALERMRVRQELELSEKRFSGIVSIASEAIISIDEDQKIRLFNQGAEDIFGYSAAEVEGRSIELLLPEPDRREHAEHVRAFAQSDVTARRMGQRGSVRGRRKNGEVFPAEASISQFELAGNRIFTVVLHDITERIRAEEALRESEKRFHGIFDQTYQFIGLLSPDGTVIESNRSALDFGGLTREEVVGRPYWEARWWTISRQTQERLQQAIRQAAAGEFVRYEVEVLGAGDRVATIDFSLRPIRDGEGPVTLIIPEGRDITHRKQIEEALRESEERLRLVVRATNEVIWEWDIGTGALTWSEDVHKAFRYAPEEVGSSIEWWYEHIHPDEREQIISNLHELVNGVGEMWSDEYRFLRGDDTYAAVLDRGFLVRDSRGVPVRMIGSMLDVTERRRAEDAQRLLAQASTLLDTSLDCEITFPGLARLALSRLGDYCTLRVIQAESLRCMAAAHVAPAKEELLGGDQEVPLNALPADDPVAKALRTRQSVLISNCTRAVLTTMSHTPGQGEHLRELKPRSLMVVPLLIHEEVLGVVTFGITESKRRYSPMDLLVAEDFAHRAALALENARLYGKAQQAIRDREQVLGVVSHDLRNPLNTIRMATGLLQDTTEERRASNLQWLHVIHRSADEMTFMIEDLLDISSIEAGGFSVDKEDHDVTSLISSACELFGPLAAEKSIDFRCEAAPGISTVWIDSHQILRVLSNLVGNAIKFTPDGGSIRLEAERASEEVRFSVADSGPGIDPEQISHVFDRYWQARKGDRRGAGLGLTIAKGIVEAHGGRIWVESSPGKGTTFFFTVPPRHPATP